MGINWKRTLKLITAAVGVASFVLIVFPDKADKIYANVSRLFAVAPRPIAQLRLATEDGRRSIASSLLSSLHGAPVCLVDVLATDMAQSGWSADLAVSYIVRPQGGCDAEDAQTAPRAMAFFTPSGLWSFRPAGLIPADPTSVQTFGLSAMGRFVLQTFYGMDRPFIHVLYMYNWNVKKDDTIEIQLTDYAENEYNLEYREIKDGILAWGTPDGVFYMTVMPNGNLVRHRGLPEEYRQNDVYATSLHWDGDDFRVPPINGDQDSWALSARDEWPKFDQEVVEDGRVTGIRLGPLDHLYVTSCSPEAGFKETTDLLPGALVPTFEDSTLSCQQGGEDDPPRSVKVLRLDD